MQQATHVLMTLIILFLILASSSGHTREPNGQHVATRVAAPLVVVHGVKSFGIVPTSQ